MLALLKVENVSPFTKSIVILNAVSIILYYRSNPEVPEVVMKRPTSLYFLF